MTSDMRKVGVNEKDAGYKVKCKSKTRVADPK